ncbi:MAG: ubiquitin-specific protease ubp1 [Ramalina farinacea]|uniref:ubiquitinyl hydrolase 1 n=1 Tax=Ramalina farinacea TaxID=258253 RepID=A0AA43QR59_9LECA|nr:ubiquitin-specific protease ubp1 [Ramalina farinacea]
MFEDGSFGSGNRSHVAQDPNFTSYSTAAAYTVLILLLIYHLLQYIDYSNLPSTELFWNAVAYIIPSRLIVTRNANEIRSSNDSSQVAGSHPRDHPSKINSMRRILGIENGGVMDLVQQKAKGAGVGSFLSASPTRALPGLGNWDNSCYQNSVLQGLAALEALPAFLSASEPEDAMRSTRAALRDFILKLNDQGNCGKTFWTPAILKNMSSWSQQDAQEYLSKVLDEVENCTREAAQKSSKTFGLESLAISTPSSTPTTASVEEGKFGNANGDLSLKISQLPEELRSMLVRNPLEGLLAQRVGCQKCGYVEGLSLVPFNCLTVPLGRGWLSDVRDCLDEYTALEPITGVECIKCTMLQAETQMSQLLESNKLPQGTDTNDEASPDIAALCSSVRDRLAIVRQSIQDKDFSDSQLKKCQIGPKNRVCTTKSRQAVIARGPKALIVHVNRSVFDELSGVQSKNYANVRFPMTLAIGPWCLGDHHTASEGQDSAETWTTDPSVSMLSDSYDEEVPPSGPMYQLRAVVTHYGRHENGHYICYRRSPHDSRLDSLSDTGSEQSLPWWRLSDEDVSEVSEEDVLSQGGVFMLFYEQIEQAPKLPTEKSDAAVASQEAQSHSPPRPLSKDDEKSLLPVAAPSPALLAEELPSSPIEASSTPIQEPSTPMQEPDQKTAQPRLSATQDTQALSPRGQDHAPTPPTVSSICQFSDVAFPIPPSTPLQPQDRDGGDWHGTAIKARTGHDSDDRFGPTLEAPTGFVSAN